jgi:hypothetical protein
MQWDVLVFFGDRPRLAGIAGVRLVAFTPMTPAPLTPL